MKYSVSESIVVMLALLSSFSTVSGCKQEAGSALAHPVAQVEVVTVTT